MQTPRLNQKPLATKLLSPFFRLTILLFIFFSFLSFLLLKDVVNDSFARQFNSIANLFSRSIREDLLAGLDIEVFRKCKALIDEELTAKITVHDGSQRIICQIDSVEVNGRHRSLSRDIYFGKPGFSKVAGKTEIWFKENIAYSLAFQLGLALFLTLIGFFIFYWLLGRYLIKNEIRSFEVLADMLSHSSAPELINISSRFSGNNSREFEQVCDSVETLSEKWILLQNETLEREKLEAEKASQSRISRQVVHDMQSPLGALKVAAESLQENAKNIEPIFKKAINRIDSIVDDLIIKSHHQESLLESFPLFKALDEIIKEKEMEFQHRDLKIELIIEDKQIKILFNKKELLRIISNIINNSVEAINSSRTPTISIEVKVEDKQVCLSIQDNGEGIDRKDIEKITEYGFTKGKAGGTGTGLAHAKKTIEEAGGSIFIESTVNVGTRVKVFLNKP